MALERKEIFRIAGWLGVTLLLVGAIRYSIENEFTTLVKGLLIVGGVLLVASLAVFYREIFALFSRRSAKLSTNTTILALAIVALLGFLNFIGFRHHRRFDFTSEKLYTLSEQTQHVVRGLKQEVDVYSFSKTPDQDLNDLMSEYAALSPHIHFHVVDPQERPDLAKEYNIESLGQAVVVSGSRNQKLEAKDEEDITGAILKVTRNTEKTVCFVEGHNEKSITGSGGNSYSFVAGELSRENYKTKSVNLVSEGKVPPDCDVLVEAGPTESLFPQEVTMMQQFLDNGGKVFVLIDPQTDPKLDPIFTEWNISAPDNIVVDASGVGRLFGMGPAAPLVINYGTSPITKDFSHSMTFFPLARTVSIADKTKASVASVELLKTSSASFAVKKIVGKKVTFNPATDMRGPLSLGVAAEKKEGKNEARLVVIGDSDFASDQWARLQRNGDLFDNTINWLSQEENLISIRPKNPANRRVTLTEAELRLLQWLSVVLLPGIVILTGIFIWWKRR